ncbi:SPOR domain-containing protein [Sphingomicrobium nitratireducens]|uniref:SPOR domain-containing protein n=1 Tax=Sphingomicrobium nitratireducens TaxID=2964666 RepID=UPI0022403696|nr:SPOR domain-containing protein [Sphingomicrobium nitratireducens]
MFKRHLGSAISAIALAGALTACAGGGDTRSASIFGGKVDEKNIGVATRAQAALINGDTATAIEFAERAVGNSPNDAGFRALLGNAYFAAGRFASADAAYRDSLRLVPVQPQVALKRALVLIAQGRSEGAAMMLNGARDMLDPADRGLALALAGHTQQAIALLDEAARRPGADGRVRQNLALAHALGGDWQAARLIASQDVPAFQLDARLQGWMQLAKAEHPSHKIASITGIQPAAVDPGQPVRLALAEDAGNQFAQIEQPDAPAAGPVSFQPAPVATKVAEAAPLPMPAPAPEPIRVSNTTLAGGHASYEIAVTDVDLTEAEEVAEIVETAPAPAPAAVAEAPKPSISPVAMAAKAASEVARTVEAPKPALSSDATRLTQSAKAIRKEAKRAGGNSRSVVQIGAYSQRGSLSLGWQRAVANHSGLKGYAPMAARATVDGKTVYRLAAHGFTSDAEARDFCMDLKRSGGTCFVRKMNGDAPISMASR